MGFSVYTLRVTRTEPPRYRKTSRDRRDPGRTRRACVPMMRVPVFRVVLRKERTIRVPVVEITHREAAVNVAHALIGDSPFEKMLAILMNNAGEVVGAIVIATSSSISDTAVSMRGIFTAAIAHNASAIILAHNHPSGRTEPSAQDLAVTRKAVEASAILGIPILDHVIVTRDRDNYGSIPC